MSDSTSIGETKGGSDRTVFVLALAVGSFAVLQSIVGPALPVLQREFGVDQNAVSWVMTAYLLSASVLTPVLGRLGDSLGKKRVLIAVLLVLSVGVAISGGAGDLAMMIIGRLLPGFGGGAFPLAFGFLSDHLAGRRLTHAIGVVSGVAAGCTGLGGVLSGVVIEVAGFRWLFWGPLIVILLTVAFVRRLPASPRTPAPLNAASVALLGLWLTCSLLVASQASQWGVLPEPTLLLGVLAIGLCGAWVMVERTVKAPLFDIELLQGRVMVTANASAALLGVICFGLQTFLPQFVQVPYTTGYGLNLTVLQTGLTLLPMAATILIMGFTSATLMHKVGVRAVMIAGPAAAVIGLVFLLVAPIGLLQVVIASAFSGAGIGATFAATSALIVDSVPRHRSGQAAGINANVRTVGGALGAALLASVISSEGTAQPTMLAYQAGFGVITVAAVLAVIVGLLTQGSAGRSAGS
jgi:MFS family permease